MVRLTEVNTFLYVDLDGVLANFNKGVKEITGKSVGSISQKELWSQLADQKIMPNSPPHEILSLLAKGNPLTKDLARRAKSIRLLERLGLLDKRMNVIDKGNLVLKLLNQGDPYIKHVDFYNRLDWMPDGKVLWEYVSKHEPVILTGLPHGDWAAPQKRRWVAREIGPNVPVLTGMARDKAKLAMKFLGRDNLEGSILVDDRPKHQKEWENSGGIWITHTSAVNSIAELKKHGL